MRCNADECEPLAVTVDRPRAGNAGAGRRRRRSSCRPRARELAKRVNYLLEPIAPIELDAQGCTVQMRSNPPQKDDNGWRYYELLIRRGGSIALCRYEKQPGQPRVRVPAVLTHEVVGRLVDDFSADGGFALTNANRICLDRHSLATSKASAGVVAPGSRPHFVSAFGALHPSPLGDDSATMRVDLHLAASLVALSAILAMNRPAVFDPRRRAVSRTPGRAVAGTARISSTRGIAIGSRVDGARAASPRVAPP